MHKKMLVRKPEGKRPYDASNNSSVIAWCICCHRNMLTMPLPSNDRGDTHADTHTFLGYNTDRIENVSNNSFIVLCVRCCGNVFTEPLHSNVGGRGYTYTQTARWSLKPTFVFSKNRLKMGPTEMRCRDVNWVCLAQDRLF
jgi:hypothetical protein